jgi:hypothetical protein
MCSEVNSVYPSLNTFGIMLSLFQQPAGAIFARPEPGTAPDPFLKNYRLTITIERYSQYDKSGGLASFRSAYNGGAFVEIRHHKLRDHRLDSCSEHVRVFADHAR